MRCIILAGLIVLLAAIPAQAESWPLELYVEPEIRAAEGQRLTVEFHPSHPLARIDARILAPLGGERYAEPESGRWYWHVPEGAAGRITILFNATDIDNVSAQAQTEIIVLDAPQIIPYPPSPLALDERDEVRLGAEIIDSDEALVHEWRWFLDGKYQSDEQQYTYHPAFDENGFHTLQLQVYDSDGLNGSYTWLIDVGDTNRPPRQTSPIPDRIVFPFNQGLLLRLNEYFHDPDEQPLRYTYRPVRATTLNGTDILVPKLDLEIGEIGDVAIDVGRNRYGNYYLEFIAYDPLGANATSEPVRLLIEPNPPNYNVSVKMTNCGDGICEEAEICRCELDCGECAEPETDCTNHWVCEEWGPCSPEGVQYRFCRDLNECNNEIDKPDTERPCIYAGNCTDGVWNQGEEGIDCGGPCPSCPSCEDGIKNGDEQGVDCGGACEACPSCEDGVRNQNETDTDCGGLCDPCVFGAACRIDSDCMSGVCLDSICIAPSCNDGVLNGDERKVDCGGSCAPCPTCDDGKHNGDEQGIDCGGACKACPSCDDGRRNQDERYIDCGGVCEPCSVIDFIIYHRGLVVLGLLVIFVLAGLWATRRALGSTFMQLAAQDRHLSFFLNRPVFIALLLLAARARSLISWGKMHSGAQRYLAEHAKLRAASAPSAAHLKNLRSFYAELTGKEEAASIESFTTAVQHGPHPFLTKLLLLVLLRRHSSIEGGFTFEEYNLAEASRAAQIIRACAKRLVR